MTRLCEGCGGVVEAEWVAGRYVYCSASCRKDGKVAAWGTGDPAIISGHGITGWGDHFTRMQRLQLAADADMADLQAEEGAMVALNAESLAWLTAPIGPVDPHSTAE